MRVLVTGGFGFIGSHVLRLLVEDGHDVACLDISTPSPIANTVVESVDSYRRDVTDPVDIYDTVADFEPECIIDLASMLGRESQTQPRRAVTVNLLGSLHVLEAANSLGVDRVIAASSASTYGDVPSDVERLTESAIQRPSSVYGVTKYSLERIGRMYQEQSDVKFAAIQPTHGLGPDRNRGNVEDALVIKAAVSGTPITVPRVDYPIEIIYVEDEARAFVTAALSDELPHSTYLIGSGEQATLMAITELVRELVPGAELTIGDVQNEDNQLFERPPSDCKRIREDLGWSPNYTIREGVETYIEWLETNETAWAFDRSDVPWL